MSSRVPHSTPSVLSGLLATISIAVAACGGADTASLGTSGPDESTAPHPPPTVTTTAVVSSTTTVAAATTTTLPNEGWTTSQIDFQPASAAAAGDRLWLAGRDEENEFILAFTLDGSTWERVDLVGLGLPTESTLPSAGAIRHQMVLGSVDDTLYGVFAAPPQQGVSSQGAGADLWLVTSGVDGAILLQGPDDTGIDQRLDGPKNFRIMDLGYITGENGRVHLFANGQWWEPYRTDDSDFTAVSFFGSGPWTTFSEDQPPGPELRLAGAATLGDVVVAVGLRGNRQAQLLSWVSDDGVTWARGGADAPEGGWIQIEDLAAGGGRFVAVGSERPNADSTPSEGFAVAWWSENGQEWNRVELPPVPVGSLVLPNGVVWLGSRFIALAGSQFPEAIWTSTDGAQWTLDKADGEYFVPGRDVVKWGDRVVIVGVDWVTVSPPNG